MKHFTTATRIKYTGIVLIILIPLIWSILIRLKQGDIALWNRAHAAPANVVNKDQTSVSSAESVHTILEPLLAANLQLSTNSSTSDPAVVVFDGTRYFVVYSQDSDVYGHFLDTEGIANSSFVIAANSWVQQEAVVAYNGIYYLVVYTDNYAGELLGQVIDTSGNLIGSPLLLSADDSGQYLAAVASDGNNFLVVWHDTRNFDTNMGDISGQLVDVDGNGNATLHGTNFLISPIAEDQSFPAVAFGSDEYLVTWTNDVVANDFQYNVYGALVNPSGSVSMPIAISTAANSQGGQPAGISFDGNNFLIVFDDERDGTADIFGVRVSDAGTVLDGPPATGGILISTDPGLGTPHRPQVVFNGDEWVVVWGGTQTKGKRVDTDGSVLDMSAFNLSKASASQFFPTIAYDDINYLVTWDESFTKYAQLVGTRFPTYLPIINRTP